MFGFGNLGVGVAIHLHDHFSAQADTVMTKMQLLQAQSMQMAKSETAMLSAGLSSLRQTGFYMTAAAAIATMGLSRMVNQGAEFQYSMSSVEAIARDTTASMKEMRKEVDRVAGSTIFRPTELTDAAKWMAMAGINRRDIITSMEAVADFAAATGSRLAGKSGSADVLTNIMTAFDIPASQIGNVSDMLTKALISANIDIIDLSEALRYAQDTAVSLKIPLEEAVASIMMMGNAGIRGTQAGTSLANMLRYLSKAAGQFRTGRQTKAFEVIGLGPEDVLNAQGNLKSLVDIMAEFRGALKSMSANEAATATEALFGIRGRRAFAASVRISSMGGGLKDQLDKLHNPDVAGLASKVAEDRIANLYGDIEKLGSAWENFRNTFVRSITPILSPLLTGLRYLTSFFQWVMDIPILGNIIGSLTLGVVALVGVLGITAIVLGTVGKAALSGGAAISQMLLSGKWAANSFTRSLVMMNAQLRLARAQMSGLNAGYTLNSAGSLIDPRTGRIVRTQRGMMAGKAAKGASKGGFLKAIFGNFAGSAVGSNSGKAAKGLGRLGKIMGTARGGGGGLLGKVITLGGLFGNVSSKLGPVAGKLVGFGGPLLVATGAVSGFKRVIDDAKNGVNSFQDVLEMFVSGFIDGIVSPFKNLFEGFIHFTRGGKQAVDSYHLLERQNIGPRFTYPNNKYTNPQKSSPSGKSQTINIIANDKTVFKAELSDEDEQNIVLENGMIIT